VIIKLTERHKKVFDARIIKIGGSLGITIPNKIVKDHEIVQGQKYLVILGNEVTTNGAKKDDVREQVPGDKLLQKGNDGSGRGPAEFPSSLGNEEVGESEHSDETAQGVERLD